ncbi:nucleic acid-binding protein [Coniophora puteana RWD-64-598 SS2]|uniref:Nucleic acid-binding protein n=1 Tax=Coniophora puteana (strain RWD-64-598) TaxID=741705 RepID=A0A5M3MPC7_CONPW|nr:nucleic acid-binding protein [Coniophora puteana RWD-64-598 SS2]EIW80963.1 nucleic acid-binding protein [Coniophora puteana RWD-64-598 SS2]
MSLDVSVAKLHASVKDLITKSAASPGTTGADQVEVASWVDKVAQGEIKAESLKDLDALLVQRTYAVSNYFSAADVALYGALHPLVSQQNHAQIHATPSLTRYFDHIQSRPEVRTAADQLSFSVVSLGIENAPPIERKVEPPKKKEKAPKAPASAESAATAPAAKVEGNPEATQDKAPKEKKEKKKKEGAAPAEQGGKKKSEAGGKGSATAEDAGEPVPSMVDLRVGHIIDIKKHPDADGLYVEQIDVGEDEPRTVVSGLVHYIPIEEMRDKYLVAVCNLKPANMRGVKSFAMVLCATAKEGKEGGIELIQPPAGSKPGERVYFEGPEYENGTPLSQMNPKKKIFETIQPGFITLDSKEAAWVNPATKSVHRIRTKDGVCVAPTLVGASLS